MPACENQQKSKDTVAAMSVRDFEGLETIKTDNLKHCFESAKDDLKKSNFVHGDTLLSSLLGRRYQHKLPLKSQAPLRDFWDRPLTKIER